MYLKSLKHLVEQFLGTAEMVLIEINTSRTGNRAIKINYVKIRLQQSTNNNRILLESSFRDDQSTSSSTVYSLRRTLCDSDLILRVPLHFVPLKINIY